MRWFGLVMVSMAAVFGGACGGESAPEKASEEPAKVEEVTREKEQGSEDEASLDCQLAKAEDDLGAEGVEALMAEWHMQEVQPRLEDDLSSAVAEAKELPAFLAERGYVC